MHSYQNIKTDDDLFNLNFSLLRDSYPNVNFAIVKHSYRELKGIYAKHFPTNNFFNLEDKRVELFLIADSFNLSLNNNVKGLAEKNLITFLVFLDNGGPYWISPYEDFLNAYNDDDNLDEFRPDELYYFNYVINQFDYPEKEEEILLGAFKLVEEYFMFRPREYHTDVYGDKNQLNIPFPE